MYIIMVESGRDSEFLQPVDGPEGELKAKVGPQMNATLQRPRMTNDCRIHLKNICYGRQRNLVSRSESEDAGWVGGR